MSRRRKLDPNEIEERMRRVPRWALSDGSLTRELEFADFVEAFGFMTRVALVAEAADHHPDWSNVYKRVTVRLSTHDVGGISELDFDLAGKIDALAGDG